MGQTSRSRARPNAKPRPRRGGRPTREQAAQLDRDVRECALQLFLAQGYERTSMDAIASAAGTTKASLYTRFPGKEAIFCSVLQWVTDRHDWPMREADPPDPSDLEGALTSIARAALRRALHPQMIQLARIAATHESRLLRSIDAPRSVAWPRLERVVDLLKRHAATGAIVAEEPEILAEHFLGMVAGVPARLASFGIVRPAAEQERYTRAAVKLFLRGLRPD